MLLIGFPAAALATNCLVLAPGPGSPCVVVDPGVEVVDRLAEVCGTHDLTPAAILLTHGHLDHTASVPALQRQYGIGVHVHADDAYRLDDPREQLPPQLTAALTAEFGDLAWTPPTGVTTFAHADRLTLAGMEFTVAHAPGHTEGSVLLTVEDLPDSLPAGSGLARTILTGDVLFAGGVGRTDLPGGDDAAMQASLRDVVLTMPDDSLVFPGHGPATTIGRERRTNPFLAHLT